MLRAVVDVNVLVSALLKHDSVPGRVIGAWRGGAFELVASPHLLSELMRVTTRPALARRLDSFAVDALARRLRTDALVVDDPPTDERLVPRDPADDYVVALARAAKAHAIVTGDSHLLDRADLEPPALEPQRFLSLVEETG